MIDQKLEIGAVYKSKMKNEIVYVIARSCSDEAISIQPARDYKVML